MTNVRKPETHSASSDSVDPKVSVVVATFNRRESLCRLLESLSKQTFSLDRFEVIVVSDGSTDGTVDMVRQHKGRFHKLEILDLKNRGPGAARNAGARLARGKYLAFTDDDCVAAPDWLEQLVSTFERTGAVGVQGRTTTDRLARSPLTHEIEILSPCLTSMPTCNAAYLRSAFERVGGFDESFKFAHDEDADLAWRVEELGQMVFAPEAQIIHPPRRDKFMKRARWVRGLESEFLLYCKNPEKYRKYVKSPSPWWTIYWKVFVIGQLNSAKSCCKYFIRPFRPRDFFVGLALTVTRGFCLVQLFPTYWKAQSYYRSKFGSLGAEPLSLVETRSTASPSSQPAVWDADRRDELHESPSSQPEVRNPHRRDELHESPTVRKPLDESGTRVTRPSDRPSEYEVHGARMEDGG